MLAWEESAVEKLYGSEKRVVICGSGKKCDHVQFGSSVDLKKCGRIHSRSPYVLWVLKNVDICS